MDIFDYKFEWNIENLCKTFQKILDVVSRENDQRQEAVSRFYEFEEAGYEYAHTSTGCNGTHAKWMKFSISEHSADLLAAKVYEATHDWPGWRCLAVNVNAFDGNGTISCELDGGNFDLVYGKEYDIVRDLDGNGHKLVCKN